MTGEDALRVAQAISATWPAEDVQVEGPFLLPIGAGGGNRVSAARLADVSDDGASVSTKELDVAARRQRASGQDPLFMVFDWQRPLDRMLESSGHCARDATDMMCCPVDEIASPPPPVSCFEVWPPLAVQEDIWAEGGVGPERLAVMHRAQSPKTSIFGRIKDRPAGTSFVAVHDDVAMLHALEVHHRSRRQGLARTLVCAAANWAQAQGAAIFAALVTKENVAARQLYASLGLKAVGHYHYRAK